MFCIFGYLGFNQGQLKAPAPVLQKLSSIQQYFKLSYKTNRAIYISFAKVNYLIVNGSLQYKSPALGL